MCLLSSITNPWNYQWSGSLYCVSFTTQAAPIVSSPSSDSSSYQPVPCPKSFSSHGSKWRVVWPPSSQAVGARVSKNSLPLLLGPLFAMPRIAAPVKLELDEVTNALPQNRISRRLRASCWFASNAFITSSSSDFSSLMASCTSVTLSQPSS